MATDPVCGMSVDQNSAEATSTYKGKTYYFCSEDCKEIFDKEPDEYTKQAATTSAETGAKR